MIFMKFFKKIAVLLTIFVLGCFIGGYINYKIDEDFNNLKFSKFD